MKKLLAILMVISLISFRAEKQYNLSLNESQIVGFYQTLDACKQAVHTSQIPMAQGEQIIRNIDSLQHLMKDIYIKQQDSIKK